MEKRYFKLQLKSIFKIFPAILLIMALTFGAIGTVGGLALKNSMDEEKKHKISIGVVGDIEDFYLDIGLHVLKNVDSARFYVDVAPMEEEEAKEKLEKREISGYLNVPYNYVENIYNGRNTPAKYITHNAPTGFGTIISNEVTLLVSDIVTESQNGMYSMQKIAGEYNSKNFWRNVEKLMFSYMDKLLARKNMYDVELLGVSDKLSLGGYYISGITILFILLFGISASRIFSMKNYAYARLLKMSGMKSYKQILCEYGSYFIVTMITLLLFATVFGIVVSNNSFGVPELSGVGVINCYAFLIKILPVIVMLTMMQMAIYECIPNVVGSVLAQFFIAIFIGYLSGCFYPNYFFPKIIQNVMLYLPLGNGFAFARKTMSGESIVLELMLTLGYILMFAMITIKSRNYKITGDVK